MTHGQDEAAGLGAADPITGVTAGDDDLASTAQLPDDEERRDPAAVAAESMTTVTNDALAGETVEPGPGDGNDGPTGGAPTEAAPLPPDDELDPRIISLEEH